MFFDTSFFSHYQNYSLVAIFFTAGKSLVDGAQADSMTRVAY